MNWARGHTRAVSRALGSAAATLAISLFQPFLADFAVGGDVAALAQGLDRAEVVSLRFEGNGSFSRDAISAAIITRQTECRSVLLRPFCWAGAEFALDRHYLNPRIFRDDMVRVQLFYQQRGYRAVQLDTVFTTLPDQGVAILFRVEEGEPHRITSLEILGAESVPSPPLDEDLPISEGDPVDLVRLDVVRDTLTRRLQNRGYAHAEVLRNIFIPVGTREAEVEFDVYTGPVSRFGEIEVVGNREIDDRVVRSMLPFGEGSLYQRELLLDAQRNIYNLEIFLNASINEDLESQPDSIIPLEVQVNEGDSHRVRAGGGWNTEECVNAETSWTSRNYFGGARRLVLRSRVSHLLTSELEDSICSGAGTGVYGELDWVVSADFTQPFIFSPRNSLAASIYAERQSLQHVFVREAVGVTLGLTRSVGRSTPLTFSYRPQIARLDAAEVFFCASFFVCDLGDIDRLQSENVLSPVGITLLRDRTNRVISATGGYRAVIDLEQAAGWTGSDFRYGRVVAELAGFFGLPNELVLAGRVRGGWLQSGPFKGITTISGTSPSRIAHPEKRFYGGGSNSVRGYAQNQLGPQVVSLEVDRLILPQGSGAAVCEPEEVQALTCSAAGLAETLFSARPTGGTRLVEGNLELRFPIWGAVGGVAFMDFGRVWDGVDLLGPSETALTPGLGMRYNTPIGPIRVDLGYRGNLIRDVPVVTAQVRRFNADQDQPEDRIGVGSAGELDWVKLEDLALLEPLVRFWGSDQKPWWRGLQLHVSIGQAF
jgi:outer membrane protein insertion porin family